MTIFSDRTLTFTLHESFHLLVNTLTGAIDIAPNRVMLGLMTIKERELLAQRGYFLDKDENIFIKLREINQKHNENIPYWFYVLTTLNCNFACPICYERQVLKNASISKEVLHGVFKKIHSMQILKGISSKRVKIVVFGGEPLLADFDTIRELFDLVSRYNWECVIVTNGSLVSNFIDLFKEYSGIISDFRITIDGVSNIHDQRRPYRDRKASFSDVVRAVDLLLENGFEVKMQTILGGGNIHRLQSLASFVQNRKWFNFSNFQWRIEGSHDYANLDISKDEISEALMVEQVINLWRNNPALQGKIKFESFKYLSHITNSFGWLGSYKTYWGPKFGFCEPQKGFHYVFSVDGIIYHCPRTISNNDFCVGEIGESLINDSDLKRKTILDKEKCRDCSISTLCGGGCVVQKYYHQEMDCQVYGIGLIDDFIKLMKEEIMEFAVYDQITSINELWL